MSSFPPRQFFVTGTDTDVGKTYFSAWLVRTWRRQGKTAAALKPISCGDRRDAEILADAAEGKISLDEVNPVCLATPAAPLAACRLENRPLDLPALAAQISRQRERWPYLLVEGVGGWRVPITPQESVREWAASLGLPVLVVARAGLGTLNHTLLTVDSIRQSGLVCAGLILNTHGAPESPARSTNPALLREATGLPLLEFTGQVEAAGHLHAWLD
jgi:dethiobiotin synthetase